MRVSICGAAVSNGCRRASIGNAKAVNHVEVVGSSTYSDSVLELIVLAVSEPWAQRLAISA